MLGFWFWVGLLILAGCAWRVCRQHRRQERRVLLIDRDFPAGRLEGRLSELAFGWAVECRCWFVWLPQAEGERKRLLPPLSLRLGFELLSAGELQRLAEDKAPDCRFYRLSASGSLSELSADRAESIARKYRGSDNI